MSLLATAASLAVLATLWWTLRGDNTLYAQALDAIQRARTFHMITTVQPDADKPAERVAESWYERGVGFREEIGSQVRLGNQKNFLVVRERHETGTSGRRAMASTTSSTACWTTRRCKR